MTRKDRDGRGGERARERERETDRKGREREGEGEYTSLFVPFSYREGDAATTSQVRRILQPARVL